MEPTTLIIGGVALYAFLKGQTGSLASLPVAQQETALGQAPAIATAGDTSISQVPTGAMETTGSVVAAESGVSIGSVMLAPSEPGSVFDTSDIVVPSDLVAALDNQTALMFRAYAALNPADFQAFLDRYADRIMLRNDLVIEFLTNPPEQGFEVSPGMLAGMGTAAYKVIQAFNGVAAGKSLDVFGLAATTAGQIPGLNQDFVSSLQGLAMGYRAITSLNQVLNIASTNSLSVMNFTSMVGAGAYPGLAALPLAGVLMAVGLVVDIAFTIIGDKPDLQKAIDVALDVASLAVLFIPVIGVVIAIVIQLVKFIIDLFGEQLFGGGMSHEQREILETARYGENLNPMFPMLADCYTPRELFRVIIEWGSGYCGGKHVVAMSVSIRLRAGDRLMVGGQPFTVPHDLAFSPGDNEQPGGCYWIPPELAAITNDEQAWAIGAYASVNGVDAMAQAGIIDWRKEQFNDPTERLIMARAQPMHDFLVKHRLSLDQIDQIALEYRAQPHLNALAAAFGWETWQEMFASTVNDEWMIFNVTVTEGSLSDFALQNGHPTMYAFRAAALATFEAPYARLRAVIAASGNMPALSWFPVWYATQINQYATTVYVPPTAVSQQAAAYVAEGMDPGEAEALAQWFANMSTP
jgi:hypothetical protein